MKIAFIYEAVYPWVKGGIEKRIYEIAKRLALKHEVHWYGIGYWWRENSLRDIEFDGIHMHAVCRPLDIYDNGIRSPKVAIYFAIKLLPLLFKENYDIIDCQASSYFSCFVARLHSILRHSSLIITWHEIWYDYWYEYLGWKGFFGKLVEKITFRLQSTSIAVSMKTKKDLEKTLKNREITIIPNGIDFNGIKKLKPSEDSSHVIYVGRLIQDKHVDVLINAVKLLEKKIPDLKCLIIGEGPERENLERLVKQLNMNDNISFMDFLEDYDDLISHMKSSKVFVLPSTREGFGIVIIEANACGLPAVVVEHSMNAATDLIKDNVNGFISKLSAEDIADSIVLGIDKGEQMRDNCIESAREYDWERIVESLEEFYRTI